MAIVRPALLGDYDAMKNIAAVSGNDVCAVKIAKAEVYAKALQDPQHNTVLVITDFGATQGFLRATHRRDKVTILQEMAVLPLRRGQGLGCEMFNTLTQRSRELGMKRINFLVPTISRANAWFKHRGCEFINVAHRERAYNLYFFGLK